MRPAEQDNPRLMEKGVWSCDFKPDGYRLPTEAELPLPGRSGAFGADTRRGVYFSFLGGPCNGDQLQRQLYVVLGWHTVYRLHGIELFRRLWVWEYSPAVSPPEWAERVGPLPVLPHLRDSSFVRKAWEI
jgi:hypothetical protein